MEPVDIEVTIEPGDIGAGRSQEWPVDVEPIEDVMEDALEAEMLSTAVTAEMATTVGALAAEGLRVLET